jgi:DNA-binding GntR family transcriptional regulator
MPTPPKYRSLADEIQSRIVSGEYAKGTQLPSEPRLGERFSVSYMVVRRALQVLRAEGLVTTLHGVGTFVLVDPQPRGEVRHVAQLDWTCETQRGRSASGEPERWIVFKMGGRVVFEVPQYSVMLSDEQARDGAIDLLAHRLRSLLSD